jgi:hypothetical protein
MSMRGEDRDRALELERKAACQIMVIVRPESSDSAECLHLPQTSHLTQCPTAFSPFLKHLTRLARASTSPSLSNVSSHTYIMHAAPSPFRTTQDEACTVWPPEAGTSFPSICKSMQD